jgi:hypothetical protein
MNHDRDALKNSFVVQLLSTQSNNVVGRESLAQKHDILLLSEQSTNNWLSQAI